MHNKLPRGFILVEVLLSVVIVSFGLLGLAKIEIAAFRYNRSAYFASVANAQASAMIECLRVTKSAQSCELYFNSMLAHLLPKGKCILHLTQQDYQLLIGWYEPQSHYKKKLCTDNYSDGFNCIIHFGKL